MLGTVVNVSSIVLGSLIGTAFNKGIKEKYKVTIMQIFGLVSIALGVTWIAKNLSETQQPMIFIFSLVVGGYIGTFLNLEDRIYQLGEKFKGENNPIEGLTTTILLFCVGTLSILGPLRSALYNDHTLLFTNALLDGITSILFASSFGMVIIFSSVAVFLWQGSIYLLAQFIAPFMTPEVLGQVSIVGGILIMATGMNILKLQKIKTINLIPSIIVVIIISSFIEHF